MIGENIIELFREKDFPATSISNIGSEMFEDSGVKSGIEFEVFGYILRESWVNEDILSM